MFNVQCFFIYKKVSQKQTHTHTLWGLPPIPSHTHTQSHHHSRVHNHTPSQTPELNCYITYCIINWVNELNFCNNSFKVCVITKITKVVIFEWFIVTFKISVFYKIFNLRLSSMNVTCKLNHFLYIQYMKYTGRIVGNNAIFIKLLLYWRNM